MAEETNERRETVEVEVTAGEENLFRLLVEALRELDAPPAR